MATKPPHSKDVQCFIEALPNPPKLDDETCGNLADELRFVFQRGEERWPSFKLNRHVFLTYLAERLLTDQPLLQAIAGMHIEDLYLTCACANGCGAAVARFDEKYRTVMTAALNGLRNLGDVEDEVRQRLHWRLFVGSATCPGRITKYHGRGPLGPWLRAITIREALTILRERKPAAPVDDLFDVLPDLHDDPELSYLKGLYRQSFATAFQASFAALSPRDRTLLRYKYCDGTTLDDLARLYRVHRATVARWLANIRNALLVETRSRMVQELGASESEFESIMRMIRSELDVNITREFQTASG